MNRRNRERKIARREPFKDAKPVVLVICEGGTEKEYLDGLVDANKNSRVKVEVKGHEGVPKTVVQYAKKRKGRSNERALIPVKVTTGLKTTVLRVKTRNPATGSMDWARAMISQNWEPGARKLNADPPYIMGAKTSNQKLLDWVDEWAAVLQPDTIEWCDGSALPAQLLLIMYGVREVEEEIHKSSIRL